MIAALPLSWRLAGVAIVLVLIGIAAGVLYTKGRRDGAAACQAKVSAALVEQENKDRALSATLLEAQEKQLGALHAQALSSLRRVANAPITSTCGPVERDATRGVQSIIRGGAAAP